MRFEHMTSCSQNRHATKLRYISKFVINTILKILEESRIRTYDEILDRVSVILQKNFRKKKWLRGLRRQTVNPMS